MDKSLDLGRVEKSKEPRNRTLASSKSFAKNPYFIVPTGIHCMTSLKVLGTSVQPLASKRNNTNNKTARSRPAKSEANLSERSSRASKTKDKREPEIRKIQLKSTSTPKLALIRPAGRRSSSSRSASSTPNAPGLSPPPAYSPTTPAALPFPPPPLPPPAPMHTGHRRPMGNKRSMRFQAAAAAAAAAPPASHSAPHQQQASNFPPVAQHQSSTSSSTTPPASSGRRRDNANRSSVYTFASASTRLGEIPESLWTTPFNYDEMVRLNEVHGGKPWPPPADIVAKPKRGLFGLFKKGHMKTEGVGVSVAA